MAEKENALKSFDFFREKNFQTQKKKVKNKKSAEFFFQMRCLPRINQKRGFPRIRGKVESLTIPRSKLSALKNW